MFYITGAKKEKQEIYISGKIGGISFDHMRANGTDKEVAQAFEQLKPFDFKFDISTLNFYNLDNTRLDTLISDYFREGNYYYSFDYCESREIRTLCETFFEAISSLRVKEFVDCNIRFRDFCNEESFYRRIFEIVEPYLSYPDVLNGVLTGMSKDFDGKYISYLRNNGATLGRDSYREFCKIALYEGLTNADRSKFENLLTFLERNDYPIKVGSSRYNLLKNNPELKHNLIKICSNDTSRFIPLDCCDVISLIDFMGEGSYSKYINPNRGLNYNLKVLNNFSENPDIIERISKMLPKLNFLENLDLGDKFTIVVPQDTFDLCDESEQQNNCVSYYYNNDIVNGTELIYFIRRKDNPKKSFITCRYSVCRGETAEARLVNNENISPKMWDFIREHIDGMIKANL